LDDQEEPYYEEEQAESTRGGEGESGDLLKKLIENLSGNPALQNESIR
jgi:hypothetical protein